MTRNWLPIDLLRTLLDFTASHGRLPAQDDRGPALAELPYDKLVREAKAAGIDVIDMRQTPRTGRGKARGTRKIEKCTAILWHQTAAMLGLGHAGKVPAHALILEHAIVLLHPIRAYMFHAGAANSFSIGVEVSCRAAGIEGKLNTLWRSKREIHGYEKKGRRYPPRPAAALVHEASPKQLLAGRLVGTYYVDETARQGGQIVASTTHATSEADRISDPGSRIALGCAQPVADLHGLVYGEPVVGSGRVTPTVWGGEPGRPYSWRERGY